MYTNHCCPLKIFIAKTPRKASTAVVCSSRVAFPEPSGPVSAAPWDWSRSSASPAACSWLPWGSVLCRLKTWCTPRAGSASAPPVRRHLLCPLFAPRTLSAPWKCREKRTISVAAHRNRQFRGEKRDRLCMERKKAGWLAIFGSLDKLDK